jgi:hypothetical protein
MKVVNVNQERDPPSPSRCPGTVRREITVETSFVEEDEMSYVAELHDRWRGDDGSQEDIHHYLLTVSTRGPMGEITKITAEALALPFMECGLAPLALQALVGARLREGFSKRAREVLATVEGCTHLLTLTTAVAAAAVPGGYLESRPLIVAGKPLTPARAEERINVCAGWREGGTFVNQMREGLPYEPNWQPSVNRVQLTKRSAPALPRKSAD